MSKPIAEAFADYVRERGVGGLEGEFVPVLEALRDLCSESRQTHDGLVPLAVFNAVVGIGIGYTAVVVLPRIIERKTGQSLGYAVKLRQAGDDGYHGYYHLPGTILRASPDPYQDALKRLTKEVFGTHPLYAGKAITELMLDVEPLPPTFVRVSFRKSIETHLGMIVDLPDDVFLERVATDSTTWKTVQDLRNPDCLIIPFELEWMRWVAYTPRTPHTLFEG